MTRETNHEGMWRALFEEHHSQLTEAAEILLQRSGSPEQILRTALCGIGTPSVLRAIRKDLRSPRRGQGSDCTQLHKHRFVDSHNVVRTDQL